MTMANISTTYITYPISGDLREKMIRLNKGIREGDPRKQIPLLVDVGVELARAGIHQFLETPLDLVELNPVLKKIAVFGIHTTEKAVTGVMKRIFTKLNNDQLRVTPVFLEHLMEQNEPREDLLTIDKARIQAAIDGRCELKRTPVELCDVRESDDDHAFPETISEPGRSFFNILERRIAGGVDFLLSKIGLPNRKDVHKLRTAIDVLTAKIERFPAPTEDRFR